MTMDNLEKQLNNLPQAKLRRRAAVKIKFKLYAFIIRQKLSGLFAAGQPRTYWGKALAAAVLVVVIFASTAWYAYANSAVTQGHALYPLKRAVEEAEKQINFSQPAKVKTYEKLSERRLEEAVILSRERLAEPADQDERLNERIKNSLDEAVVNIGAAAAKAQEQPDQPAVKEAGKKVEADEERHDKYLQAIEDGANTRRDEDLLEKVKAVKEAMRQYRQTLKEARREESGEEQLENQDDDNKTEDNNQAVQGAKIKEREPADEQAGRRDSEQPENREADSD